MSVNCRLDMLKAQCHSWSGSIAAVVYSPVRLGQVLSVDQKELNSTPLHDALERVKKLHKEVDEESKPFYPELNVLFAPSTHPSDI